MASELRVNSSTNRSGLGTITYTDSGPIVSGVGTFANGLTVDGTQTTVKSLKLTGDNYNANWFKTSNKLRFNDDAKATFGTADDLSIYHNGSNSYVKSSTGNLWLGVNNYLNIAGGDDFGTYTARFLDGGAVELYYNGNKKFETTNTGAVVTGILTTGNIYVDNLTANSSLTINNNSSVAVNLTSTSTTGSSRIFFGDPDSALVGRINYAHNGDHMQFYTAYAEKLRIQGNGFVGIGTNNAVRKLHLHENNAATAVYTTFTNGSTGVAASNGFTLGIDSSQHAILNNYSSTDIRILCNGSERLRILSSGELRIISSGNNNDPAHLRLHSADVSISTNDAIGVVRFAGRDAGSAAVSRTGALIQATAAATWDTLQSSGYSATHLDFFTQSNSGTDNIAAGARLRITSDGQVQIKENAGTSSDGASMNFIFGNNNSTDVISSIIFSNNVGEVSRIQGETRNGNTNGMITFHTDISGSSAEKFRVNHDGGFCYGTNSSRTAEFTRPSGFSVRWDTKGQFQSTVSNETCGLLNREGSDGGILSFRRGGTGVGEIGVNASTMYLNFGGTNAEAHQLDDYEEGSYTPSMGGSGWSYTRQVGFYRKVGTLVHVSIWITASGGPNDSSVTTISLPFSSYSASEYRGGISGSWDSANFDNTYTEGRNRSHINSNNTVMQASFPFIDNGGWSSSGLVNSGLYNGFACQMSGSYMSNA